MTLESVEAEAQPARLGLFYDAHGATIATGCNNFTCGYDAFAPPRSSCVSGAGLVG